MTSLMSIFDPSMSISPHWGWVVIPLGILMSKFAYWQNPSSIIMVIDILFKALISLFKRQQIIFVTLFFFILNMNLAGLLPVVYSCTSHLSFNMSVSLTLWLGMMIWYLLNNLNQALSHMTPTGSPMVLVPVLVLIELVSSLIRPLTLSLRLMANVMAGHMILTLISSGVITLGSVFMIPMSLVLMGFLMFEFGVALIQSYVFSSLMALYWEESESSH